MSVKQQNKYKKGDAITVEGLTADPINYLIRDVHRVTMSWVTLGFHKYPILVHDDMIKPITEHEANIAKMAKLIAKDVFTEIGL